MRPQVDPLAPRLGCTASRLRKAARRVTQIFDQQLEPYGLTITQYGLLARLKQSDGISIGALAEAMIMDPTTLSRNLRPMEARGLITMTPDPSDKRARCLHLTREGRDAFTRARPGWARAQRTVEDTLGLREATTLNDTLDRSLERLTA